MSGFRGFVVASTICVISGCAMDTSVEVGRADYEIFCADCHGADAKGDGAVGALLPVPPADLTRISARRGGEFPRVEVMTVIDGYVRGQTHGEVLMPEFGPILEGETVLVDTGDGVMTPTPERLVALADYLATLQEES